MPDTLTFTTSKALTPELITHIESVVWGFETGVRYRILERESELRWVLPTGHFLLLKNQNDLLGTLLCIQKTVSVGKQFNLPVLYETTLTVVPSVHGQGHAKNVLHEAGRRAERRYLEYAYIEETNIPSAAAFKAHRYEIIGQFFATTFNRLRPKLSKRVKALRLAQLEQLKASLSDLYGDHAFTDFDVSLRPEHYWVLMDGNEIIGGAQVEEELWSIVSMPGPDGWFATKILPYVPFLNLILNPRRIPVLKIGNLFVPEGREKEFMELVEHLTRHYHKKLALAYLDKKSPITRRLKEKLNYGLFNLFFETPVNIWARAGDQHENALASLKTKPFHISPLDIS